MTAILKLVIGSFVFVFKNTEIIYYINTHTEFQKNKLKKFGDNNFLI